MSNSRNQYSWNRNLGTTITLSQGDSVSVPIRLTLDGLQVTDPSTAQISLVEFTFANLEQKYWKTDGTGAVAFNTRVLAFMYPLTTAETSVLDPGDYAIGVRVKFTDASVVNVPIRPTIRITTAASRATL